MKRRKFLICMLVLSISTLSYCQSKQYIYYFDKDMNSTSKVKAIFEGTGLPEGGLVKLHCYSSITKKLVLIAHFRDSTLSAYQGLFPEFRTFDKKPSFCL